MSAFIERIVEEAREDIKRLREDIKERELVVKALTDIDATLRGVGKKAKQQEPIKSMPQFEEWVANQAGEWTVDDAHEFMGGSYSGAGARVKKMFDRGVLSRHPQEGGPNFIYRRAEAPIPAPPIPD